MRSEGIGTRLMNSWSGTARSPGSRSAEQLSCVIGFISNLAISLQSAKVVIYEAFVEGKLEASKHLARTVHDLYFAPKYEEFRPRITWSLSNAFTSAFKELEPIPQFGVTAKLGEFLEARFSQSF
jgi:hypothetical protein